MLSFDYRYAYINEELDSWQDRVSVAHQQLHEKTGLGNDYLVWLDYSEHYDRSEVERIKALASLINEQADVFLVCGIGGSYLGARSAIEMLQGLFPKRKVEIIYCGHSFSADYINQLLPYLANKSVYLNVISKSGATTETAVAFRILRQYLEKRYGQQAKQRIIATTDGKKGTLKNLAEAAGYPTFVIPADIGGRFSVMTPVGLLPLAVAGCDIDEILRGYKVGYELYGKVKIEENPSYQYAVCRRILDKMGKTAELFVSYEPQLAMMAEWWKQLFGESEGKQGLGLLPGSVNYSTDLHSMGQFVQDGRKIFFETLLLVKEPQQDLIFPADERNDDQMNYLGGKSLDFINKMATQGTLAAHYEDGKVPNLLITIDKIAEFNYGLLIYFFFKAVALSVYLNNTNPFDQPGVEIYKKRMYKLLGKE